MKSSYIIKKPITADDTTDNNCKIFGMNFFIVSSPIFILAQTKEKESPAGTGPSFLKGLGINYFLFGKNYFLP